MVRDSCKGCANGNTTAYARCVPRHPPRGSRKKVFAVAKSPHSVHCYQLAVGMQGTTATDIDLSQATPCALPTANRLPQAPRHAFDIAIDVTSTTTDNSGRFTLLVHPPQAEVFLNIGNATIHKPRIPVSPAPSPKSTTYLVEHADLLLERERKPPVNCLSSRSGAIVKGHTTSQADIDDLVVTGLARFVVDPEAISRSRPFAKGNVTFLNTTIAPHHQISLPPPRLRGFHSSEKPTTNYRPSPITPAKKSTSSSPAV